MRPDLQLVADLVRPGSRVLDLGCGDGQLLAHLIAERGCGGTGIESDAGGFHACLARGVPVRQADLDEGLPDFRDASYDVVILSQTLQATRRPAFVLRELMRVGRSGIVSFPNFGHWRLRLDLLGRGRMPVSSVLPFSWWETPNIHLCTLRDFEALLRQEGVRATRRTLLDEHGASARHGVRLRPNLLAAGAVYRLDR